MPVLWARGEESEAQRSAATRHHGDAKSCLTYTRLMLQHANDTALGA